MTARSDGGDTDPMGVEIRALTGADAEAYAILFIEIWRETYADLMPAERLDALDVARAAARMRAFFDDSEKPVTYGAFAGTELVGWVRAGAPRDDDAPCDLELWSLNVSRSARGSGVARHLMEFALSGRDAYLWVVDGNSRALRFYEREGFVTDGVRRWEPNDQTHELRMRRRASESVAMDSVDA